MKKALIWIIAIIIIGAGIYFYAGSQQAQAPVAPTPAASSSQQTQSSPSITLPAANQGATEVSNPNAPKGTPQECAQCDQYSSAQKAQCLVALNC